ncbi:hypothetical protein [Streptomyces spororaveus]|uniref:hypothetical protein n=1 Tax=Streptomyces spororaveus TaxID=284039 RepID=UPI0037898AD0
MDPLDPLADGPDWPADKLTALRLGRRLVTEVPASSPSRRAFVDITPALTRPDDQARAEGWTRSDKGRRFHLQHREYDGERIDGFDYDIGAVLVSSADAADEAALLAALTAWGLRPGAFVYPWETDDPQEVRPGLRAGPGATGGPGGTDRACRKAAPPVVPGVPPSWQCWVRAPAVPTRCLPVSARATPGRPGPPCRRPRYRPGRPGPRRAAGPP